MKKRDSLNSAYNSYKKLFIVSLCYSILSYLEIQILVIKEACTNTCQVHKKVFELVYNIYTNIWYYFKLLFVINIILLFITIVLLFILKADFLENVNTCYERTMPKKSPT